MWLPGLVSLAFQIPLGTGWQEEEERPRLAGRLGFWWQGQMPGAAEEYAELGAGLGRASLRLL